jgi:hypothetical protein
VEPHGTVSVFIRHYHQRWGKPQTPGCAAPDGGDNGGGLSSPLCILEKMFNIMLIYFPANKYFMIPPTQMEKILELHNLAKESAAKFDTDKISGTLPESLYF